MRMLLPNQTLKLEGAKMGVERRAMYWAALARADASRERVRARAEVDIVVGWGGLSRESGDEDNRTLYDMRDISEE